MGSCSKRRKDANGKNSTKNMKHVGTICFMETVLNYATVWIWKLKGE